MQKQLRIDYRLNYRDLLPVLLLLLVCTSALWILQISWQWLVVLTGICVLASLWQWRCFLHVYPSLHFDGEQWCVFHQQQKQLLCLLPESFVSRYFLVLVFRKATDGKRLRFCFSRNNCSEASYRALCRLALQS